MKVEKNQTLHAMIFDEFIDRQVVTSIAQKTLGFQWRHERQLKGLLPPGNERHLGFLIPQHRVPGPDRMSARWNIRQTEHPIVIGYGHIGIGGQQQPTLHEPVLITFEPDNTATPCLEWNSRLPSFSQIGEMK